MKSIKILFVCLGNTCRSPMAEAVMLHWIRKHNLDWQVDSAALRSWNVGRQVNERCILVLRENHLTTKHLSREITLEDFDNYDYILGMDYNNVNELENLARKTNKKTKAKIELLGSYIGRKDDEVIPDPYFTSGMGSFRSVYTQINESCRNFIKTHT